MANIWKCIIGVAFLVTCWTAGVLVFQLYQYFDLNGVAKARIETWDIVAIRPDCFAIKASYTFDGGRGTYIFNKPYFPNAHAAKKNLENWEKFEWAVWYKTSQPQKSALQKLFPFKALIHAVLSMGVCLYFTYLFGYSMRLNRV